jgi:hypothetical protein
MFCVIYRTWLRSSSAAIICVFEPKISFFLRCDFASTIISRNENIRFVIRLSGPFAAGNASARIPENGIHTGSLLLLLVFV